MPTTDRKLRVFLCHSSQDKPIVRELYRRLLLENWVDPWLDEEELLPGQDWDMEIEKAVESADAVLVFLSNNSVTKEGYVQRELRFVLDIALTKPEETIFVIPIRLDDCNVPRRLRIWQYSDYFPKDAQERGYSKVLRSLNARMSSISMSTIESKKSIETFIEAYEETTGDDELAKYENLVFLVHNISKRRVYSDGVERYPIRLYIDSSSDSVLDQIEKVVYHLHPSFEAPDREGEDRVKNFELQTGIWGEFYMSADIYFRGHKSPLTVFRYLNLFDA